MTIDPIPFRLAGSSTALPARIVSSDEIDILVGQRTGWTQATFKIAERRWAGTEETSSFLGAEAARVALADARWEATDLDAIVGCCGVMEQPIPSTAALIHRRLGLGKSGIPAFDVNATCRSMRVRRCF